MTIDAIAQFIYTPNNKFYFDEIFNIFSLYILGMGGYFDLSIKSMDFLNLGCLPLLTNYTDSQPNKQKNLY